MNQSGTVDIYILQGFSNYFDRRIFFYESLTDYLTAALAYEHHEDINFNPADGVKTYLDVLTDDGDKYSYLLVVDSELGTIISRWFITEADRNLAGQYRMSLKRDVVAESIGKEEFVVSAPVFVEKGILPDTDPMIVNSEGMTFNQIKTEEQLIDKSGLAGPWIVGYMANDASISGLEVSSATAPAEYTTYSAIATAIGGNMTEADLTAMVNAETEFNNTNKTTFSFILNAPLTWHRLYVNGDTEFKNFNPNSSVYGDIVFGGDLLGTVAKPQDLSLRVVRSAIYLNTKQSELISDVLTYKGNKYFDKNQLDKLLTYDGAIVLKSGSYYKLNISVKSTRTIEFHFNAATSNLSSLIPELDLLNTYAGGSFYIYYDVAVITITEEEYITDGYDLDISNTHGVTQDSPYTIFAIPYSPHAIIESGVSIYAPAKGDEILKIANAIAIKLGSKLYDLQLVPYIPLVLGTNTLGLTTANKGVAWDEIYKHGTATGKSVILYLNKANFKYSISSSLAIKDSLKVDSQCRFYRLCSPNYNGVFEFNLAKNGGSVSFFEVEGTLKPYTPFFRVTPQFSFLYGNNYKDGRGLICGGDYSLPIMSNAWENYQIQNKNYANIFAREVQNLDVMQRQESIQEKINAGAGLVAGAAGGALAGAKTGKTYGIGAGAAAGGLLGVAGGLIDVALGEERRKETKDFMIDRFNFNLMNIKALPDSLVKNSAFNYNNKLMPFIEVYEPTEVEIKAFKNKIKYDGMTVGRIGTVGEFMGISEKQYFKGQLIRAEGIIEDSHFIDSLYEELAKGVYI